MIIIIHYGNITNLILNGEREYTVRMGKIME